MANVLETSMNYLQTQDPEVAACIENEFQRQKQNIELIASENIASMYSRTPARRPIWRSMPRSCSRAIRSWAWILPAAAI